ncbi:hypothetical protein G6N76_09620 [Rhizobium daejeonense]|uniref:Uncharacterized protein n=1 Tax=Rhizobium daejeonense TaxID=240521 RepID=A0A6M1RQM4_9HYPH|nr:hypothetical protein [Rhizobium daejeonense]NGO63934.1 hypothetical protein [Rhizobium daejeonense]
MTRSAAVSEFDPFAIAGHNGGPPLDDASANDNQPQYITIFTEIDDLYDEAKNWADGEAIASQEMHDAIEKLYNGLHEAGKKADDLRKADKKPLDDKIDEIQKLYNPYIQPKKGKVDLAKSSLGTLLAAWRKKVADEKAAEAAAKAAEAAEAKRLAEEAIRSSSGNLAAREEAEELLDDAKKLERGAKRADKAATTWTGLRSVWVTTLVDEEAAIEWAWGVDSDAFRRLSLSLAEEKVRGGARELPGFSIVEDKVAR